jgi:oxidase EvaA
LKKVTDWNITDEGIHHKDHKFFSVIPVSVAIGNREVQKWNQPLLKPAQEGLCAFIVKEINGVLQFLVQAKLECGNLDIIELAPTVQCLIGNYHTATEKPPYLDYVLMLVRNK